MAEARPYPPLEHMLADLCLEIRREAQGVSVALPAVPEVCGPEGGVGTAALGVAVDVLGGNLALREVSPDWCVTSTLELHRLRPGAGDPVVRGRPLRAGRTHVVLDVEVEDEGQGPAAVASMTFTRVARRPGTTPYREAEAPVYRFGDESSRLRAPFLEQIGCRVLDAAAGAVELPITDYVRNSIGALQGGAVVALVDAAAGAWAGASLEAGAACQDLQLHFLSLGQVGPVRSRARWLAGDRRQGRLRVELVDAGQDERLMSVATVRMARFA